MSCVSFIFDESLLIYTVLFLFIDTFFSDYLVAFLFDLFVLFVILCGVFMYMP